jgi:nicotinamide mononucleotide (NMN) deamidase PncC
VGPAGQGVVTACRMALGETARCRVDYCAWIALECTLGSEGQLSLKPVGMRGIDWHV